MNNKAVLTAILSGVAGGLVGGVVTYLTVKKTFEERANREIQDVKDHYRLLRKEDGVIGIAGEVSPGPQPPYGNEENLEQLQKAQEIVSEEGYASEEEDEQPFEHSSIFDAAIVPDEALDYVAVPGEPYLIPRTAFEQGEPGYDADALIYYEADDTLYDALRADTVEDIEAIVGRRHLEMFGRLSDDPDVVYVRNDNISTLYEISRSTGEYQVDILGLDPSE